ncbi:unnamed protein product [Orchesella dallaii]|uniref:NB-ARC domain-containing protein n=1 Tax=Orchesella dallaii TaxID=48710 RepID=A0ABP1RUJ1_9HEXA
MEVREKKHIQRNLSELVSNTIWNTTCISALLETGVFGDDDIAILESIPDQRMRILKFYQLIMTKQNSYQHVISMLEKGQQSGAAKILRALNDDLFSTQFEQQARLCSTSETDKNTRTNPQPIARSKQSSLSVRFDVDIPTRLFTGRMKELEELHEMLQQSKNKPAVVSQMASVAGLGGIGKTELARMYIQQYSEEYNNTVIWISAETEETLTESFRRLASDYLKLTLENIDGKEKHQKSLIDEVYKWFEHKTCLFVFDNAESNEDLKKFLPLQVPYPPFVLITSRDREWSFGVKMLELNEMDELDAVVFVLTGLEIQDQGQHGIAIQMVKTLQCFPLALSQAISYIKQQQMLQTYSIGHYLEEYKSCSERLLSCDIRPAALSSYTETTFTTWKLTTNLIFENKECGKEAMQMLNMISYFQPDKIPTKLLLKGRMGSVRRC